MLNMKFANIKKVMRKIYKCIYYFDKVLLFIPWIVGKACHQPDMVSNFMIPFAEAAESMSDCYTNVKFRPKRGGDSYIPLSQMSETVAALFAIVLQGPIAIDNDFTFETARYYEKLYPGVLIVISTWDSESKDYCERFSSITNCRVVYNKKPEHAGMGNKNMQAVSSLGGISFAKSKGKNFILKTRSDVRICNPEFLPLMKHLIDKYPCNDVLNIGQKYRLIIFGAYLLSPFSHGDFYSFGYVDDMIEYWKYPLQNCDNPYVGNEMYIAIVAEHLSMRQSTERGMNGEGFAYDYLKRVKPEINYSIQAWWDALRNYFIALPHTASDFLWYKYDYNHEENNLYRTYVRTILGGDEQPKTVGFMEWLDLYNDNSVLDATDFEYIIDKPMC